MTHGSCWSFDVQYVMRHASLSSHRLLVVLKSFPGLLIGAGLLPTLPLDVTLLYFLQKKVGPAQPPQDRVGRFCWQEH